MRDDYGLADGKTDPQPAFLGGEEAVEDTINVLTRDAGAAVADREHEHVAAAWFDGKVDVTIRPSGL